MSIDQGLDLVTVSSFRSEIYMSLLKELDLQTGQAFYKHLAPTGANDTLIAELESTNAAGDETRGV